MRTAPGILGFDQASEAVLNFPASDSTTWTRICSLKYMVKKKTKIRQVLRRVNPLVLKRVTLIKTFPSLSYALDKPAQASGTRSSSRNGLKDVVDGEKLRDLRGHFLCSQLGDLPCARQETAIRLGPWGAQRMLKHTCP